MKRNDTEHRNEDNEGSVFTPAEHDMNQLYKWLKQQGALVSPDQEEEEANSLRPASIM